MIRNPKLVDTPILDCIPQVGPCPIGCSQCFYNRSNAFYCQIDQPNVPTVEEVGNKIVRMNCGNDSNNQHELVIETAKQYKDVFFNTSINRLAFPGPVVLTANPKEEDLSKYAWPTWYEGWESPSNNLMFVRLRVSSTNLELIDRAVEAWTAAKVPVVLTFMSYYDKEPEVPGKVWESVGTCYEWKVRHINSYWCPTKDFMRYVMRRYRNNRLVSMCGSIDESYCKACRNCETNYIQTKKRMKGE